MIRRIAVAALLALMSFSAAAEPLRAREWFVRAGAEGGDGSQAKPFADPWMALEKCEAGDLIHITGGKYYGKLNQGIWNVPFDNVQVIGGYDQEFKTRDPWTNRTELKWDEKSKNWPNQARLKGLNCKGCVIDGITIDHKDSAPYTDETKTSRKEIPGIPDNSIEFNMPVTVRNCVVINPANHAISAPPGSVIENNLVVNGMIFGISIYTQGDQPAIIKNNTLVFGWGFKEPGKGAYDGALIMLRGPATITNNIIAHSDSNSIYQPFTKYEKVSITKNVFHQNLYSNLKTYVESKGIFIDDKNMGDMEELGLKSVEGNEILDPELPYDPAFLDLYSKRTAYVPGKVTMDDMNKLRQLRGLPIIAKGGTPALGVAPAYNLDKAIDLMTPKNEKCKAGARKIPLESKVTGAAAAAPTKVYPKGALMDWVNDSEPVNGKPMEMIIAVGAGTNIGGAPKEYDKEKILGFQLYDPEGNGKYVTGFMMKGSNAERLCAAATGRYDGRGKPQRLHVVKGIIYHTQWVPKGAFFVEVMENYEPTAAADDKRPPGRDWFIVAGAAGGNGTKEKPFRDPWQALEKSQAGDSIHVAEGEYYGKLKVGKWKIDTRYISLLGGYNKEFTERNPWTHPTLLLCPTEFKGTRGGYTIEGEGEHTGAVVDGFIFDKRTNNQYRANGDIDRDRSDAVEHIWLFYPGVVIRNNVFLNGNGGALRVCNGATIENNIFINHMYKTISMTNGHTIAPSVIRNNTLMFSWEMRFGEGRGRGGSLIYFWSDCRSIVDNNIFEFADNDAIVLALNPQDIVFTNNVFSHNLWSHVSRSSTPNLVVDGSNFKQMPDLGFKQAEGNLIVPKGSGCPVDEKFFNVYLSRTAYTPGKVSMDEWNQLREMLGQPVLATGGKGPEGFMPLYPWKSAMSAFPKNPEVKAGARIVPITVKFEGIERKEETHEYAETNWDAARDRSKWDALANKRVWMKVTMRPVDNQYQLDDIKAADYTAFQIGGPEGSDSPGLPMRCYVKKGTQHERMVKNARDTTRGKPEEFYIIKGIARQNRSMVVEVVEKTE